MCTKLKISTTLSYGPIADDERKLYLGKQLWPLTIGCSENEWPFDEHEDISNRRVGTRYSLYLGVRATIYSTTEPGHHAESCIASSP